MSSETRPPRVVRLEVSRTMPLYVARLSCGHATFERLRPCVAQAFLMGRVLSCTACDEGKEV